MLKKAWKIEIFGTVQGVGFRPFIYKVAKEHSLKGWVKNKGGYVEIAVYCDEKELKEFLGDVKNKKPGIAKIEKIKVTELGKKEKFEDFFILKSEDAKSEESSFIPPDICICDECLKEIFDEKNKRRYLYPFTVCTNCGPRFSIIVDLPYDRKNTSMQSFEMCDECLKEYKNVFDRRYHAEPTSCKKCGPKYEFLDGDMQKISDEWPKIVKIVAKKIEKGKIIAIKGIGGFHLCCDAKNEKTLAKIRELVKRPQKPFAIMIKDLKTAEKYCVIDEKAKKILDSISKPILVVEKRKDCSLPNIISPGLSTLGIMLPYAPIHHIIFHFLKKTDVVVMTSANISGFPMAKTKDELKMQGKIFDYVLDHNREIVNRIDDSVIKIVNGESTFVRRSRGYVPSPIYARICEKNMDILAMGGDMMNSFSVYKNGKIYQSQYIGDLDNPKNVEFLNEMINKFVRWLRVKPKIIVFDKNPAYISKSIALEIAESFNSKAIEVQHHFAHMHSLMCEFKKDELVAICVDGTGYGNDSKIWGGEILSSKNGREKREYHIEYFPMPGCEKAIYEPWRIVAGLLHQTKNQESLIEFLDEENLKQQANAIMEMLDNSLNTCLTSSLGRFLDACALALGICKKRTYEGELAIKLEGFAEKGEKRDLHLDKFIKIKGQNMEIKDLFLEIWEMRKLSVEEKRDVAYSLLMALGRAMGNLAIKVCKKRKINCVGLSGGVAYNGIFVKGVEEIMKENEMEFVVNKIVPRGDNGLCIGQLDYALEKITR